MLESKVTLDAEVAVRTRSSIESTLLVALTLCSMLDRISPSYSSWGATNLATLWLLQAKDDTLAEFTNGGAFFSLQDSYGRVNGPTNMWSNESVPLGTLECGEVFYMSTEKLVVTAGVYRKGVTQTSEWFVGRKVRNSSSSSGWTFQTMHRGHIDYGSYYSAKTAYEAFPSSVGGGRHVVFGEALPVGPTPPGGSKDGVGAVAP